MVKLVVALIDLIRVHMSAKCWMMVWWQMSGLHVCLTQGGSLCDGKIVAKVCDEVELGIGANLVWLCRIYGLWPGFTLGVASREVERIVESRH